MAELKKFKTSAVSNIFLHANRTADDGHSHKNETIDLDRTHLNYQIKSGTMADWRKRMKEVFHLKSEDMVSLIEAIVTLPKDVRPEDERTFFQKCYEFFAKDFGEKNVIYATVHKDEVTPHIHIGIIPVKYGEVEYNNERGRKALERWERNHGSKPDCKICCSEIMTRKYLIKIHARLQEFVDEGLGYHTSILNGATVNGNKTVLELKVKSLTEQKDALERKVETLQADAKVVQSELRKTGIEARNFDLIPLLQQIENLQAENKALKNIVMRNGFSYRSSDFPKPKPIVPASTSLKIFSGRITDAEIPNNSITVIEIPKRGGVDASPQREIIDTQPELKKQAMLTMAVQATTQERISVWTSPTSNKKFAFIQTTESDTDTVQLLVSLEQMLKNIEDIREREVYMERLAKDKFDLARTVLSNLPINYFEGNLADDAAISLEEEKSKEGE